MRCEFQDVEVCMMRCVQGLFCSVQVIFSDRVKVGQLSIRLNSIQSPSLSPFLRPYINIHSISAVCVFTSVVFLLFCLSVCSHDCVCVRLCVSVNLLNIASMKLTFDSNCVATAIRSKPCSDWTRILHTHYDRSHFLLVNGTNKASKQTIQFYSEQRDGKRKRWMEFHFLNTRKHFGKKLEKLENQDCALTR